MLKDRKKRAAAQRVKAGNGRPMKRYRAWQPLSRALYHLDLTDHQGRRVLYSVDVPYWQRLLTENGEGRAHLYLDGGHHLESTLPAVFTVPGGAIEVEATSFGLKRCHYVGDQGTERRLRPDPRSAEGRRARMERERPGLSRCLRVVSLVMLAIPIVLGVPQIVEALSQVPPVAERWGTLTSPVNLPLWLNSVLGLCASAASVERATRLRWSRVLDGSG